MVEETYDWLVRLVDHGLVRFAGWVQGILRGTKTGDLTKMVRDSHIVCSTPLPCKPPLSMCGFE